ncbi:MAG: hypothetical protein CVT66_11160 [Actinobacteria bacterium HGW-Actinobacteria-6]|nr:MAG: hypothetical protein CVT66_11160 [Actinobacteria bacterium HGW-Actinobacteria-6]
MNDRPAHRRLGPRFKALLPALVFATALSIALVYGSKIVFTGGLREIGFSSVSIKPFAVTDVLWVAVLSVLLTLITSRVPGVYEWLLDRGMKPSSVTDRKQRTLLHAAASGGMAIAWLPMLLTYAPGGLNADALFSIKQALYAGTSIGWDNHHPVLYALFLQPMLELGARLGSINLGMLIATVVQYIIMAGVLGYSVVWLAKQRAPVAFVISTAAFYALFPTFAIFAVTLSNDSLFAALILLYSLHLVDVIRSDGQLLNGARGIATFIVLGLLLIFCRNNGVLVVALAGLTLAGVYRMRTKLLYPALIGIFVVTAIVQGPVYDMMSVNKPLVEALGIPLQQMGYVVVTGGDISAKDKVFIDSLLPAEEWALHYSPSTVDPLKAKDGIDKRYLSQNKKLFATTWLSLLYKNPEAYVQSYMLETFGYWKPVIGRAGVSLPLMTNNKIGIHRTDLIERATGRTLGPLFDSMTRSKIWRTLLNIGVTIWLAFLSAAALFSLKKGRYTIALTPLLGCWLALMIAAPIAFTYRYLLMFVICLPLALLLPLIASADSDAELADQSAVL